MTQNVPRPRILFVNRSYWPDVEATGQLLTELCEDLGDGFDVHILCGQPQRVVDGSPFVASGTSRREGVTIHRTRHTRFNKASFAGRLLNMLTFQAACSWRAFRVPRPDVVITETDPPFLCLLGWALKSFRRCRLICYLQDVYPDVAVALGKLRPGLLPRILRRLFFAAYRRSDAVIVLSADMRELVIESGVPAEKVCVVPNWVDSHAVFPVKEQNRFRSDHALADKFVVMYSGNIGMSQRLERLLDAAEHLRGREEIVIVIVGDGAEQAKLEQLCTEKRLQNVRFVDYRPKSELADSLSAADLHIVVLQPDVKRLLMPSKLYAALASGTPVLALADPACELAQIVVNHDLGVVTSPTDIAALTDAILEASASRTRLLRQGRNARRYAETHCDRRTSVEQFRKVVRDSLPAPPATRELVEPAAVGACSE